MRTESRRSFLAALSGVGAIGMAGCLGGGRRVSVLSAGSLALVLEDHVGREFEDATGIAYRGEYYGSNAVMRMIEDRQKAPDVAISADSRLLRDRLYGGFTDWDLSFAANSVGLAYAPETWVAGRLDDGDPWYEVVLDADAGELAIADPDLDPLGYRAIHAFRLAEQRYGLADFTERVVDTAYLEPDEPQLLAGVETGNRAAAVAYHNMANDHGLPFLEFPDAYNFSDPDLADQYADVSYTTDEGYTARGTPVIYNTTVLDSAKDPDAGRAFVRFLADARDTLRANGLRTRGFPRTHGAVPDAVAPDGREVVPT